MCFIATILRPLRSKRAMTSPVSPRSNASGFTRIRVRSISSPYGYCTEGGSGGQGSAGGLRAVTAGAGRPLHRAVGREALAGGARGPGRRRPWGHPTTGRRATRTGPAALRRLAHLGLAVGADLPARIERLAADGARLLEPAQAAGAAQERLLGLEPAVLAVLVLELGEPGLCGRHLELPLAHVLEVLRR